MTVQEILQFVRENDVKFIRMSFCDLLGAQKNISIMASELERAVREGISFDAAAVAGFLRVEKSDLFLHPDLTTMRILPWRPQHGRVMRLCCDIRYPDGAEFEGDARMLLRRAVNRASAMGYRCGIGVESEFYLFRTDELGNPTDMPFDNGGYLDIAPLDRCEQIRREICIALEQIGILPESSHHEQGPGQNEVDFRFGDAMAAADDLLLFKSTVKAVAAANGLFASFMPKPLIGKSGSGLHVNLSLTSEGRNLFCDGGSPQAEHFMAGILFHTGEMTAVLNPLVNSYARLGQCEAPKYISWSHQNRSQLVRIPAAKGNGGRMELRSPDPACNPYLSFALLLEAGMEGIQQRTPLPPACDGDMYSAAPEELQGVDLLPANLPHALSLLESSAFARGVLGERVLERYVALKRSECSDHAAVGDAVAADKAMYFLGQ